MNRKDIFMSGFKSKLTYPFNYKDLSEFETIVNFYEEQIKKYKEVINKAINYIDEYRDYQDVHKQVGIDKYEDVREDILFEENIEELLEILKEVEHEKSNN